ncbi:membrane protein [Streptomyces zinciresistens K42]|uniref:Membrane protein n=1 Tax=Streptomyces zinciresistens K42 TaxID=700597 RepID=G2GNY0_9ACTN|nr:membrane protein [Streptomyces zinciresistens K42]
MFEEFDPARDCDCPGCAHWRRVLPHSTGGRHPAARRALVVAAAAATGPAAGYTAAAAPPAASGRPSVLAGEVPGAGQAGAAPTHGSVGGPARPADRGTTPATTRARIIERAAKRVAAKMPYSLYAFRSDGYRRDCPGFVSMAWNLPGNEGTGSLGKYGVRIAKKDLGPGDILLFHNPADPRKGPHAVVFGGWTDSAQTAYAAYEQTPPRTRRQTTPYAYWSNSERFVAYRYKGLAFGPAEKKPVTSGTGKTETVTNEAGTEARTEAGTEAGTEARTEARTEAGTEEPVGRKPVAEEPGAARAEPDAPGTDAVEPDAPRTAGARTARPEPYPGPAYFGPGAHNRHVARLGRMLVERGAGHHYLSGPGPRWTDADRRATRAFQLAQGWRGRDADGRPGPATWRLLATGTGRDVVPVGTRPPARPASHGVPGYPGRALFRPGAENAHVTALGRQLISRGFGRYHRDGPGPRWAEADRRAVAAFQRAQGWRGGAADGSPGPETWRRLFAPAPRGR